MLVQNTNNLTLFTNKLFRKHSKNTSEHDTAQEHLTPILYLFQTSGSFSLMAHNMLIVSLAMIFRVMQIQTVLRLGDFATECTSACGSSDVFRLDVVFNVLPLAFFSTHLKDQDNNS